MHLFPAIKESYRYCNFGENRNLQV